MLKGKQCFITKVRTVIQRTFLVEKKLQGADVAQIRVEYALYFLCYSGSFGWDQCT